jgi:3-oxoacyl-[acyl-carrier-protein] synthase II
MSEPIAITGLGAVCSLGVGVPALWSAIAEGRDGIRPIERFPTAPFAATHAALVPGFEEPRSIEKGRIWPRELAIDFAVRAIREAALEARVDLTSSRTALVLGTCMGDQVLGMEALTDGVARALDVSGPCFTVSTACASSATALATVRDLLDLEAADVVLAAGADVLTLELFAGFAVLGLLAPIKCAPFSTPFGISLGEGAGALVVEKKSRAQGRRVHAWLTGYGLTADGHHPTSPAPDGSGVRRALIAASDDSGVGPDAIRYVNTHGTGTESNDASEWQGIKGALGEVPISSTKSYLGHAQGAGVTCLVRREGQVAHAAATYLSTSRSTASRLRGPPRRLGKR